MSAIRVLLVDDHAVVRAGYKTLLDGTHDIDVVAEAGRGEEACQRYAEFLPDLVVMDLSLPGIGGLEAIRRIVARDRDAAILVFSMHDDTAFVEKALAAGARGYITKNSAAEIMVDAIRAIASGQAYIDHELAQNLALHKASGDREVFACLTTREFQIFNLLAHGLSPTETASELSLSYKTVANYTTQIKSKLNVKSTTELVHLAIRHGVIDPISE
ncbi:MAG: response regulator transcription factor [Candidatus Thiodiazotropha sp. 6PLUC2]